jgi:hypothetical protein
MGLADVIAVVSYLVMVSRVGVVHSFTYLFGLLAASSLGLVVMMEASKASQQMEVVQPGLSASLSLCVIGMRIASFSTLAINYSQVVQLTPTLLTGKVFSLVNTAAKSLTILAPLAAELLSNAAWTCAVGALAAIMAVPYF